jgi:hypothetical protein
VADLFFMHGINAVDALSAHAIPLHYEFLFSVMLFGHIFSSKSFDFQNQTFSYKFFI